MLAHRVQPQVHRADHPDLTAFDIVLAAALSAPSRVGPAAGERHRLRDPAQRRAIETHALDAVDRGNGGTAGVLRRQPAHARRIAELRGGLSQRHLDMFMNAAVDASLVMRAFAPPRNRPASAVSLEPDPANGSGARAIAGAAGRACSPSPVSPSGIPAAQGKLGMRLPPAALVHVDRYDGSPPMRNWRLTTRGAWPPEPATRQTALRGEMGHGRGLYVGPEDKAPVLSVPERHNFGDLRARAGFALK